MRIPVFTRRLHTKDGELIKNFVACYAGNIEVTSMPDKTVISIIPLYYGDTDRGTPFDIATFLGFVDIFDITAEIYTANASCITMTVKDKCIITAGYYNDMMTVTYSEGQTIKTFDVFNDNDTNVIVDYTNDNRLEFDKITRKWKKLRNKK